MVSRRLLLAATIVCLFVGALGVVLYAQQRVDRCAAVPLLAPELLHNADLGVPDQAGDMPQGWGRGAASARYGEFTVLPGGRSLQLIGIANYVQTPATAVRPDTRYCFQAQAISDSERGLTSRLQLTFQWLDSAGTIIAQDRTPWQQAVLWQKDNPPAGWSFIEGAFIAPERAASLQVRVAPSSDERVYLDQMHLRTGGAGIAERVGAVQSPSGPQIDPSLSMTILPWPDGRRAALSFSFDWETAMGGLVHSRSQGDPNYDQDFLLRGMRMREGVTTTLEIFRPYRIRATYYATGYNFLKGNTERRMFMGNPIFAWATPEQRWISDRWTTTPWFADDPYGTIVNDPAWYFGDLVPMLQNEQQDIQSHTFSHLYGGLATTQEWQADMDTWREVAGERGVAPARSLAFPWSGSGGMSDAAWDILEQAGIRSVTRLSDQPQYRFVNENEPHCKAVPGHERILACPDFYLTPKSAGQAKQLIDRTLAVSGTLDLWAHTEEVTSPDQIAAWRDVVSYAAGKSELWIAPLDEIASWQQALDRIAIEQVVAKGQQVGADRSDTQPMTFTITNHNDRAMDGLTIGLPEAPGKITLNGTTLNVHSSVLNSQFFILNSLAAGETVEVQVWPR